MLDRKGLRKTRIDSTSELGLHRNERTLVVEVTLLTLRPLIKSRGVDDDLPGRIGLNMCAVHRPRRRSLEVYPFAGVAAPVARALELVLAGLPIGRASQVSAPGVDDEQPFGVANNPDAVLLLEFRVDAEAEIGRVSDSEDGAWFEDGSRKEEAKKHHEAGRKEPTHSRPYYRAAHLVDGIGRRAFDSLALSPCRSTDSGLSGCFGFVC